MKTLWVLLLLASLAGAQTDQIRRDLYVQPGGKTRRLALVIGNDAYTFANPLHNAVNDAASMKTALEGAGFTVQIGLNVTQPQMETAIDEFTGGVKPGDVTLFFYAGHGVQISDQNYLIPVDFQARTAVDAKYKAYPAQRVLDNLEAAGAAIQILVLDACRNNPLRSLRGGAGGLAAMQAGRGAYIAFATSPGSTAADNPSGRNGLFTGELLAVLREPGLGLDQVFNRVRERVSAKSQGKQLPWSTSSVVGDFYFRGATTPVPPAPSHDLSAEQELAFWSSIKDLNDRDLLDAYLQRFPNGLYRPIAERRLASLRTPAPEPAPPVVTRVGPQPGDIKVNTRDGQRYVWIPPGTFQMGCSPDDNECSSDEKPAHTVTLTKGFWMGQTAVTVGAYKRYVRATGGAMPPEPKLIDRGLNPGWNDEQQPIVDVTWDEAKGYCEAAGMRLPTEAEWERAARGGTAGPRYGNLSDIAWYADNSGRQAIDSAAILRDDQKNYVTRLKDNGNGPKGVGLKQPNAYRLYDILGNVYQWVADSYGTYDGSDQTDPLGPPGGKYRAARGGSWGVDPRDVRASGRDRVGPAGRSLSFGVRCAGELP